MKRFGILLVLMSSVLVLAVLPRVVEGGAQQPLTAPAEAPAGFNNQTNGFVIQSQFDQDRDVFEEREGIEKGLGPVYNAQACAECHQNPTTGAISQVTEVRAGHLDAAGNFVAAPGGSLINDRAIDAAIQERVPESEKIRALRTSLNTLGDGFVEALSDETLLAIARAQERSRDRIAGQAVMVPVLEANNALRVGRFGWKAQHASLLSFSADAYLNEMGITSPLMPDENTSLGRSVAAYDTVADPENNGNDVEAFARFMRATQAPPRDAAAAVTPEAQLGAVLFNRLRCNVCHVTALVTAPADTPINGGMFTVPPALGNKIIHPYSDFLLHDVGTGDGVVQNGGPETANRMRTPPLWGVRTRTRLMHDGASLTLRDAIVRHGGEATDVIRNFRELGEAGHRFVLAFLKSL
jgi:CxxC motif-containing protein (DUF1111 family)